MKTLDAAILTAIADRRVLPRDFLEIAVKNRSTGALVYERYWSDVFDLSAVVTDPETGGTSTYTFQGVGPLVMVDNIPRVANLTVPEITIKLLAVGVDIDTLVRTYDARQATVRMWRGFLDPSTRAMVAPADPRFFGFVDTVELPTGSETEEAACTLTCLSHSQEMTRSSTETRSDASQKRRSATDDFFASVNTIGDDVFFWGSKTGKIEAEKPNKLPPGALR